MKFAMSLISTPVSLFFCYLKPWLNSAILRSYRSSPASVRSADTWTKPNPEIRWVKAESEAEWRLLFKLNFKVSWKAKYIAPHHWVINPDTMWLKIACGKKSVTKSDKLYEVKFKKYISNVFIVHYIFWTLSQLVREGTHGQTE